MTTQLTNTPRLGILMCGHSPDKIVETYGRYDSAFSNLLGEQTFDYKPFFVVDGEFPDSTDEADAWLITGSKHGAYEPLPWIKPLEALIRQIYEKGMPMVGICFGHQILAQALGGRVVKHDGGWIVGTQQYTFKDPVGVESAALNAWHQDQVIELPDIARAIGSSDTCEYAGIFYRENTASVQPHPEFENDYLDMLLQERGDALPTEIRQAAQNSLGENLTNKAIATWLTSVLMSGST